MATILFVSLISSLASAEDEARMEVPSDELAKESVYPVFEDSVSVKNRNVATAKRFDIGIFGGLALTEPIFNTIKFGLAGNYHFSEEHSLGLIFTINNSGLSRDAQEIKDTFNLDFTRAPKPKLSVFGDYNYKPFYGKLSIAKNAVINTTIYGSLGLGMVQYDHKSFPGISVGVGERFYLGRNFSIKTDFRLIMHNAPIPFKGNVLSPNDPVPSYSDFEERLTFTSNLELGLNYLF
jgi:outer membrane beta-barrel protein